MARIVPNHSAFMKRNRFGASPLCSRPASRLNARSRTHQPLLVSSGLARIYGTCTPLPDGRDSREYLAHLHELENEAKAAKRGGWGMVQL